MNVTLAEMNKINNVQINILREVTDVCKKLGIKYFMVHGSLLGTIRNEGFIPYDDDIDIAIPREQYDRFLEEAPKIIDSKFFIQSNISESNYPLVFAKVRDKNTTYVVENIKNIDMNHGIYIDIFPIDFVSEKKMTQLMLKLYNLRITTMYETKNIPISLRVKQIISCIICPSVKYALQKRSVLVKSKSKSDKVCMTGGKSSEKEMPAKWFSEFIEKKFEGIDVYIPNGYDEYLRNIYGDYEHRTLVEGKMLGDKVNINACFVDTEKPYTNYVIK